MSNYLVVWGDDARAFLYDVYAMRVSTAGALGDGTAATGGVAISTAAQSQGQAAVAFDGTNHLIVWIDSRALVIGPYDIYGMRVSRTMALQDGTAATGGFLISSAANAQTKPAAAYDGTNYLVVWEDSR